MKKKALTFTSFILLVLFVDPLVKFTALLDNIWHGSALGCRVYLPFIRSLVGSILTPAAIFLFLHHSPGMSFLLGVVFGTWLLFVPTRAIQIMDVFARGGKIAGEMDPAAP